MFNPITAEPNEIQLSDFAHAPSVSRRLHHQHDMVRRVYTAEAWLSGGRVVSELVWQSRGPWIESRSKWGNVFISRFLENVLGLIKLLMKFEEEKKEKKEEKNSAGSAK